MGTATEGQQSHLLLLAAKVGPEKHRPPTIPGKGGAEVEVVRLEEAQECVGGKKAEVIKSGLLGRWRRTVRKHL